MNAVTIISATAGVLGIVFGLVTLFRNKKHDDTSEGKSVGTMLSDLGYIKAGIDEIKSEQKEQRTRNMDIERRLTSVEESTKQAHKRIDELRHE